jgi:hypothetical protein
VILENDELGKIKDRGMVSLSNDKGDAQYVLLMDDLKHNLLSVITEISSANGYKNLASSKQL